MPTHYIPDTVTVVSCPVVNYVQEHTGKTFQVRPSFVVPTNSPKMLATARGWAKRRLGPNEQVTERTTSNSAIQNLQVVGIEHRREGGIAFKVITEEGYLVDLRESEFMEALLTGAVGKDGFIKGQFAWSVGGNQMRIVRIGSQVYKDRLRVGLAAKTASGKSRTKYLPTGALTVGRAYNTASSDEQIVFAGRVRRLADRKLLFAWFIHRENPNSLGRGAGTKELVVTSKSVALKDLGLAPSLANAPITNVRDGFGAATSKDNFIWANGQAIRSI